MFRKKQRQEIRDCSAPQNTPTPEASHSWAPRSMSVHGSQKNKTFPQCLSKFEWVQLLAPQILTHAPSSLGGSFTPSVYTERVPTPVWCSLWHHMMVHHGPKGPLAQDKAEGVSCPAPYRQALGSPNGDQPSHKAQHHGQPRRMDEVTRGTHSHPSCQHCVVDMSLQRNSLWVNEVRHGEDSLFPRVPQPAGPRPYWKGLPTSVTLKPPTPLKLPGLYQRPPLTSLLRLRERSPDWAAFRESA